MSFDQSESAAFLIKTSFLKRKTLTVVSRRLLRAPGHSGRRVPGREGPEAGGCVEGGRVLVDGVARRRPAGSAGKPPAEAAGSGQPVHAEHRRGCGETSPQWGLL